MESMLTSMATFSRSVTQLSELALDTSVAEQSHTVVRGNYRLAQTMPFTRGTETIFTTTVNVAKHLAVALQYTPIRLHVQTVDTRLLPSPSKRLGTKLLCTCTLYRNMHDCVIIM